MSKPYKDDEGLQDDDELDLQVREPSKRRISFRQILLAISLTTSTVLLSMSVFGAYRNHQMLGMLEDYAVDVVNATNKTWGYGTIPSQYASHPKEAPSHSHSDSASPSTPSRNEEHYLSLPAENETIIYGHIWKTRKGEDAYSVFPVTSDIVDSNRPNSIINDAPYNLMIEKGISTVLQYTRRPTANATFRATRKECLIQGFFPPLQSLHNNKTLITNGLPVDVWRLVSTVPGSHWSSGREFIGGGNYSLRAGMTWATRPDRAFKLGSLRVWPGMNQHTKLKFPCPTPDDKWAKERVAIELACEDCYVRYDSVMRYPILQFELVF